jgi:hypothetical protein
LLRILKKILEHLPDARHAFEYLCAINLAAERQP